MTGRGNVLPEGAGVLPLSGVKVLDFCSLLPGPLATLFLSDAGASVVKIERPDVGDPGRKSRLPVEGESVEFGLINRGKKSLAVDLKNKEDRSTIMGLIETADILVEQFRPGVMKRLGLDYETLSKLNSRLIYCSISGYGQTGPLANRPGHDLNYLARSGSLFASRDQHGAYCVPVWPIADIGGGTYPAVVNMLMALRWRDQTGRGCHIDVAMCENMFAMMRRMLASEFVGLAPQSPPSTKNVRNGIFQSSDGVALAVAPLEDHFWKRFCEIIGLERHEANDGAEPSEVYDRVSEILAGKTGAEWLALFDGEEVCVERIQTPGEAINDPHFRERGVFDQELLLYNGTTIPAMPLPLSRQFVRSGAVGYPKHGDLNESQDDVWRNDIWHSRA
jgi:crotonobetainyl-CoA:carnitine CoA-transferase CaiB-like acyl-CoA transferase